jgi:hypothetical protein
MLNREWKHVSPPGPEITAGRRAMSELTDKAIPPIEPQIDLVFNAEVFGHRGEEDVHQRKVKYLFSLIDRNSPNKSLLFGKKTPYYMLCWFKKEIGSCSLPEEKGEKVSGKSHQKIYKKRYDLKTNFNNESVKILLEKRECWFNYWKIKLGIQEEFNCYDYVSHMSQAITL